MAMKSPSKTSTLIRGGQTTQHWWRMALQVFRFAVVSGAAIYFVAFCALVLKNFGWDQMRIAFYYEMAQMGIEADNGFVKAYRFRNLDGQIVTMEALDLYRDATLRSVRDDFFGSLFDATYLAMIPAVFVTFASLMLFIFMGNRIQDDEHIRGARLVDDDQLKRWSHAQWRKYRRKFKGRKKGPMYTVADIPFPPNSIEAQTSLVGTVGVGKTNAMLEMLVKIRALGGRAIIYDRSGAFVSKFYDPETDIIINPFDTRSHSWKLFSDVTDVASLTQIAEVMIQTPTGSSDPFWTKSARVVFEYAARQIHVAKKGKADNGDLLHAILNIPASKLGQLIANTPGAHFFNEEIEKTALSIRANLIADLRFLEFLRDDGAPFSMRGWVKDEKPGFVFLAADAEHAAANRNIFSAITEISVNALMSQGQTADPRIFFFFDEIPSLNKMPFLLTSLAEVRQYGGAFVLGYQVFSQLESVYGHESAQTITGTVNNRIVFNTPDAATAGHCSENLGLTDTLERTNSITVGAHEARDGVAFQQNRTERPIVTASQIQSLPQFEAYIRFAYDAPTALVTFKPIDLPDLAPCYLPYLGSHFHFGILDAEETASAGSPPTSPTPGSDPTGETAEQFYAWAAEKFRGYDEAWYKERGKPPTDIARFWDHFAERFHKGVDPAAIVPLCVTTDALMSNGRAGQKNAAVSYLPPWAAKAQDDRGAAGDNQQGDLFDDRAPAPVTGMDVAPKPVPQKHKRRPASTSKRGRNSPDPVVSRNATSTPKFDRWSESL